MGLKRPLSTGLRVLGFALAVTLVSTIGSYRSTGEEQSRVGTIVSDFTLRDVSGHKIQFSLLTSNAYIIDLWATWCPPCREEIPNLVALQRKYRSRGLRVIGIAMDEDGIAKVKPFVEENHVDYTVLLADASIEKTFGEVDAIPTTWFVDRFHKVKQTVTGYEEPALMETEIQSLLGGEQSDVPWGLLQTESQGRLRGTAQ